MKWISLLAVLFATTAWAGSPHVVKQQFVQHGYGHAVAQKVLQPVIAYQPSYQLQAQGALQYEKDRDPLWQEFLQFKQFQQFSAQQPSPVPSENQAGIYDISVVAQKCAKCHSGPTPKGGMVFDGVTALPDEAIVAGMRAVWTGEMPPSSELDDENFSKVLAELLSIE